MKFETVASGCAVVAIVALLGATQSSHVTYPATRTDTTIDTYFGRQVADPDRWHNSRKMVAPLQADTSSDLPVLLLQKAGQGASCDRHRPSDRSGQRRA